MRISWRIITEGSKPRIQRRADGVVRDTSKPFQSVPYARQMLERKYKRALKRYRNDPEKTLISHGMGAWEAWVDVDQVWMKTLSVKVDEEMMSIIDRAVEVYGPIYGVGRADILRGLLDILRHDGVFSIAMQMSHALHTTPGDWIGKILSDNGFAAREGTRNGE